MILVVESKAEMISQKVLTKEIKNGSMEHNFSNFFKKNQNDKSRSTFKKFFKELYEV